MDIELKDITPKEIIKGFHGRLIHTEHTTIAYWEVEEGSEIPVHSHHNEQIMQVTEGRFELTVDGDTRIYEAGTVVYLPPHVPHGGKALTPCKITDIFSPVREEYR
ncbi:cupin domain-containing protein [Robertkochia aurantiaca]|uniref:cupin domain-containing protein n=1 Tax=Robertkochia aurantiaca TaxID=2873700 RepID=UPI001CCFD64D|nr:cupin domain-containing protein [Robertkochia sp. 3YJGBD-33]